MLHRNSDLPIKKTMDVILKHKIRNLRAKLKNLLASESCNKYSKRQRQVKKNQSLENKQFYMTKALFNQQMHLFTHTKEEPKNFWYSQKQKCNVMNVFGKLTKDEIQQIQEDLIYYLGQDNIEKFKAFLEIKQTVNRQKQANKQNTDNPFRRIKTLKQQNYEIERRQRGFSSAKYTQTQRRQSQTDNLPIFQKDCSITDNFFCFRKSIQTNQQSIGFTETSKRLKTANLLESRASTLTKRSSERQRLKFQANYLGNRQLFMNKRRMIEQQQNTQRLLTKVNLELKQEKATDIFRVTQDSFISTIKEKNTQNDSKTKRILDDKHKKNVTFGTIVELNEELRKIYIKKISQNPKVPTTQFSQSKSMSEKQKGDSTFSSFFRQTHKFKL